MKLGFFTKLSTHNFSYKSKSIFRPSSSVMQAQEFLTRLGITDNDLTPSVDLLLKINKAHVMKVPFENLDLHMHRDVSAELDTVWKKIVTGRRGGWCHEQVVVLEHALKQLGFQNVRRGTGRVFLGPGVQSPPGSHAFALVTVPVVNQTFLMDVGFPDTTVEPLNVSPEIIGKEQKLSNGRVFKVTKEGNVYTRHAQNDQGEFQPSWQWIDSDNLQIGLYEEGNNWVKNGPNSPFLKNTLVSKKTSDGRFTLSGLTKIVTVGNVKTKTEISREEFIRTLKEEFDIDLPNFFQESQECNESPLEGMLQ